MRISSAATMRAVAGPPSRSQRSATKESPVHHQQYSVFLGSLLLMLGLPGVSGAQTNPPAGYSAPAAERPLSASSAAPAGEEPRETRLLLETNATCSLRLGGVPQQPDLAPGERRSVIVAPGDSAIECTSTTVPEATIKRVIAVPANSRQEVALDLAEVVVNASCAGKPATLADLGGGVLRHCVTRSDWTQEDSGPGGMFWDDARAWCGKRGAGWGLPTADELAELIDRSGRSQTACSRWTCNVSPRFRLTSPLFWTNQFTGPGMVMQVNLMLGGRHPTAQDANLDYHTLCIRRASSP